MRVAELTITLTAPAEQVESIEMAAGRVLATMGGTDIAVKAVIISEELKALGMRHWLNACLTGRGIDTVDKLCGLTQAELLAQMKGFGSYLSLREIILLLASQEPALRLTGHEVPLDDLVELLKFTVGDTYGRLKRAGLDAVSQVAALDVVALRRISRNCFEDLRRALRVAGITPAPLRGDRRLRDLRVWYGDIPEVLRDAGFGPGAKVSQLTEASLRIGLREKARLPDDDIGDWVECIRDFLKDYQYELV